VVGRCLPGAAEGYGLNAGCVVRYSTQPFYLPANAGGGGGGSSSECRAHSLGLTCRSWSNCRAVPCLNSADRNSVCHRLKQQNKSVLI
jgi:hypothetical protein